MRTVAVLFAIASAAVANPWLETYMSEFGVDSAGRAWVEFNVQPDNYGYFRGVLLTTSCSECTLDFELAPGEYVVLDSEVLAQRVLGRGKLRFNPLADSLYLTFDGTEMEGVRFPVVPTGWREAPAPPPGGSVASCNLNGDTRNWYVDSTPTRGGPNDDFSSISGRVDWDSTVQVDYSWLWVTGCYGTMHLWLYAPGEYVVPGLGAGTYQVQLSADIAGHPGRVELVYPESVRVGYSQTVGGINFTIPSSAVAEQSEPQAPVVPRATLVRGTLLLPASGAARARRAVLVGASGSSVLALHPGRNDVSGLSPGVYFVREELQAASLKLQAVRKVVVTR